MSGSYDPTITWQGVEGGIYRVDPSADLTFADTSASTFISASDTITVEDNIVGIRMFYRLAQTGLDTYDQTEFSSQGDGGPGGPSGGPGGGGPA